MVQTKITLGRRMVAVALAFVLILLTLSALNLEPLTVSAMENETITISAQNGTLTTGTADSVAFNVTTEGIANSITHLKVACVGDSTTVGNGASNISRDNYPVCLSAMLSEADIGGISWNVRNFGAGGTTVQRSGFNGAVSSPYRNSKQFTSSKEYNPDVVLFMLGTNDAKDFNRRPGVEAFMDDYIELVNEYRSLPSIPRVYLVTPVTLVEQNLNQWLDDFIGGTAYITEVTESIKAFAASEGLPVIDINAVTGAHPDLIGDGVHPNSAGYRLIAETVFNVLRTDYNESTITLNNINGIEGIALDTNTTTGNSTTVKISTTEATPAGSHPLTFTIEGVTSDVFYLVVDPALDPPTPSPSPTPSPTPTPSRKLGDVNGDGEVKLDDVQMALKGALNIIKLTDEEAWAAEMNENGQLTLTDVQTLLRVVLNIIPSPSGVAATTQSRRIHFAEPVILLADIPRARKSSFTEFQHVVVI